MTETLLGLADFLGDWHLSRRIDDRLSGQAGRFDGLARITATTGPGQAQYEERGTLQLGAGAPMTAERRYLWTFHAGGLQMRFADGREFVTIVPAGSGGQVVHLCGADTYRVSHDFTRWPCWQAVWTVTGPRKDYVMRSCWGRSA